MSDQTRYKPSRYKKPLFGEFGALSFVGDRIVCHICGNDFLLLGSHVWWTHGVTADEYRRTFGLKSGTSLRSKVVRNPKAVENLKRGGRTREELDAMREIRNRNQQTDHRLERHAAWSRSAAVMNQRRWGKAEA